MALLKELIHNSCLTAVQAVAVRGIPQDHFVVHTRILGIESFYLLKGEAGDLNAEIVGRLESPKNKANTAYKGSGLKYGKFIGTNLWFLEAWEQILA
jgi:hypothetical protein